jgi:hypothetical protein
LKTVFKIMQVIWSTRCIVFNIYDTRSLGLEKKKCTGFEVLNLLECNLTWLRRI